MREHRVERDVCCIGGVHSYEFGQLQRSTDSELFAAAKQLARDDNRCADGNWRGGRAERDAGAWERLFPPTGLGASSVTETVTVQNNGNAAATFYAATITGPNASKFTISPGAAGGCPLQGGTIPASSSCTIAATFTSTSAGSYSATLNVSDNAAGSPQSVPLSGTAVTLGASLSTKQRGVSNKHDRDCDGAGQRHAYEFRQFAAYDLRDFVDGRGQVGLHSTE